MELEPEEEQSQKREQNKPQESQFFSQAPKNPNTSRSAFRHNLRNNMISEIRIFTCLEKGFGLDSA